MLRFANYCHRAHRAETLTFRACAYVKHRGTATQGARHKSWFLVPSILIQKGTIGYGELFAGAREEQQDDAKTQGTAPGTETQSR